MQQTATQLFHRSKSISLESTKPEEHPPPDATVFIRRIGCTNYHVKVHCSQTATETLDDKIFRLMCNETAVKM